MTRLYRPEILWTVLAAVFMEARAETVVLKEGSDGYSGTADNSIYEDRPSNTNGGHAFLYAGNTKLLSPRRALIKFDLAPLPPNAVVTTATLILTVQRSADNRTDPEPHSIHRLAVNWGEGTVDTLDIDPESDGGAGSPAQEGDATWSHNFFGLSNWATSGGDFATTATASAEVRGVGSEGRFGGAGVVEDLNIWLADPGCNFGWIILGNEIDAKRAKRFYSSEGEFDFRPRLEIFYELGTPTPTPSPTPSPSPTATPVPNAARGWRLYDS